MRTVLFSLVGGCLLLLVAGCGGGSGGKVEMPKGPVPKAPTVGGSKGGTVATPPPIPPPPPRKMTTPRP
jgi:hypothetical protein